MKRKWLLTCVLSLTLLWITGAAGAAAAQETDGSEREISEQEILEQRKYEDSLRKKAVMRTEQDKLRSFFADGQVPEHAAYDEEQRILYFDDQLAVCLMPGVSDQARQDLAASVGGSIENDSDPNSAILQIRIQPSDLREIRQMAADLMENDAVLCADYAYPALVSPTSSMQDDQGQSSQDQTSDPWTADGTPDTDLGNEGSPSGNDWSAEAVGAYTAWEYEDQCEPHTVGILDNGFDTGHPDLSGKIQLLPEYPDSEAADHGTHVAGIIGAIAGNGIGLHGIDAGASLLTADWAHTKDGTSMLAGTEYVNAICAMVRRGARTVNNSWGSYAMSFSEYIKSNFWDDHGYISSFQDDGITLSDGRFLRYKDGDSSKVKFYTLSSQGSGITGFTYLRLRIPETYDAFYFDGQTAFSLGAEPAVLLTLENGEIAELDDYGTDLFSHYDFHAETVQAKKDGSYKEFQDTVWNHNIRTAEDCIIGMGELMMEGEKDFIIVESAGNGLDNSGPGVDASRSGYFCAISKSIFDELPGETLKKFAESGIEWEDIYYRKMIVGAVKNEKDTGGSYKLTDFSNFGDSLDICAPGNSIFSTVTQGGYDKYPGTSMSAPIVSGAIGYLWSLVPDMSAREIKTLLLSNTKTRAVGSVGQDKGREHTMLNMADAVEKLEKSGKLKKRQGDAEQEHAEPSSGEENGTEGSVQAPESLKILEVSLPDIGSMTDIKADSGWGISYSSYEKTGYGPSWDSFRGDYLGNSSDKNVIYRPDAVIFEKDGIYGVLDFEGNVLISGLHGVSAQGDAVLSAPQTDSYRNTYFGLSMDNYCLLSVDFRQEFQEPEDPYASIYDFNEGDAGFSFVDENGQLCAGDLSNPSNIWAESTPLSPDLQPPARFVLPVISSASGDYTVTGSAVLSRDGTVQTTSACLPKQIRGSSDFVNGYYVTAFYEGTYHANDYETQPAGFGLVSADSGQLITKESYEDVKWFEDGLCPVKKGGKWAYINEQGDYATDFLFDDASAVCQGRAYVSYGGQYHLIELLPPA